MDSLDPPAAVYYRHKVLARVEEHGIDLSKLWNRLLELEHEDAASGSLLYSLLNHMAFQAPERHMENGYPGKGLPPLLMAAERQVEISVVEIEKIWSRYQLDRENAGNATQGILDDDGATDQVANG